MALLPLATGGPSLAGELKKRPRLLKNSGCRGPQTAWEPLQRA